MIGIALVTFSVCVTYCVSVLSIRIDKLERRIKELEKHV